MKMYHVAISVLFLALALETTAAFLGCAGKPGGTVGWTQATPTSWDYGYSSGALLGRVVENSATDYTAYGCNNAVGVEQQTLANAEMFVETSCKNVGK